MTRRIAAVFVLAGAIAVVPEPLAFAGEAEQSKQSEATCAIAPMPEWSESESWAWTQICTGKIADLNQREGRDRDPATSDGWPRERIITPEFVEALLSTEPYRSAVPRQGIRIKGARFNRPLELENATARVPLELEDSRFQQGVTLDGFTSASPVSFQRSHVVRDFTAYSASIGRLELPCVTVEGRLWFTLAKIRGYLWLEQMRVSGDVISDLIDLEGHALIQNSQFGGKFNLRYSRIAASLDLNESRFHRLDLTGTKVLGELQAGYNDPGHPISKCRRPDEPRGPTEWRDRTGSQPAELVLRNASADVLKIWHAGWPALDLQGFAYTRLQIQGLADPAELGDWGIAWLARDRSGSFQPYQQYADTIAKTGLTGQANTVLFAGRERERERVRTIAPLQYVGMTIAKYSIGYGYGYRYFFALGWAALLIAIAYVLIQVTNENDGRDENSRLGLLYCIDMLLPLIQFRKLHFEIEPQSKVLRGYFVVHRIAGFVLGSFILAGMAGLTK